MALRFGVLDLLHLRIHCISSTDMMLGCLPDASIAFFGIYKLVIFSVNKMFRFVSKGEILEFKCLWIRTHHADLQSRGLAVP